MAIRSGLIRRQAIAKPFRATPRFLISRPAIAINQQSLATILTLLAKFRAARESQELTFAEVAERMGIDAPALSRLETGKVLNPTLATLRKWADALGRNLRAELASA